MDNNAVFIGHPIDLWAYPHNIRTDISRPGKPTDNTFMETFNGLLRNNFFNFHLFENLAEAKYLIKS